MNTRTHAIGLSCAVALSLLTMSAHCHAQTAEMSFQKILESVKSEHEAVEVLAVMVGHKIDAKKFDSALTLTKEATELLKDPLTSAWVGWLRADVFEAQDNRPELRRQLDAIVAAMQPLAQGGKNADALSLLQLCKKRLHRLQLRERGIDPDDAIFKYTLTTDSKETIVASFHYGNVVEENPEVQQVEMLPPRPPPGDERVTQNFFIASKEGAKIEFEALWTPGRKRDLDRVEIKPPDVKRDFVPGQEWREVYTLIAKEGGELRVTFVWKEAELAFVKFEEIISPFTKK